MLKLEAAGRGLLVNFAETHDNNRLAARSAVFARLRCALCALLFKLRSPFQSFCVSVFQLFRLPPFPID